LFTMLAIERKTNMNTEKGISDKMINEIIEKHKGKPGALLSTLEEVQENNPFKFLPKETLVTVAKKLNISYSQVYSVATFYSFFNLKPRANIPLLYAEEQPATQKDPKNCSMIFTAVLPSTTKTGNPTNLLQPPTICSRYERWLVLVNVPNRP